MALYRVYTLDRAGHIAAGDWVEVGDDAEIVETVRRLCGPATPAFEIWRTTHRVAVVDCRGDIPPAPG
ncbi:hypothetical protein [Phenylobacterium sp.]|uniref:hypothetical protein n=1 Tax=Phenylobacterium sp. TaxID=1871053 RepID=UPI0028120315|nr:hypothetical protein [Phenylobacterium sp.]